MRYTSGLLTDDAFSFFHNQLLGLRLCNSVLCLNDQCQITDKVGWARAVMQLEESHRCLRKICSRWEVVGIHSRKIEWAIGSDSNGIKENRLIQGTPILLSVKQWFYRLDTGFTKEDWLNQHIRQNKENKVRVDKASWDIKLIV